MKDPLLLALLWTALVMTVVTSCDATRERHVTEIPLKPVEAQACPPPPECPAPIAPPTVTTDSAQEQASALATKATPSRRRGGDPIRRRRRADKRDTRTGEPTGKTNAPTTGASLSPKLDLNTASRTALIALPGVGPKTADRIIARRVRRPFRRTAELRRIKGIGRSKWLKVRDLIEVRKSPPSR